MKKSLLVICMLITFSFANKINAQVRVNLNLNIGNQPCWGPTGYDHVEYYYLPDIECYYNVPRHRFVYMDDGRWIFSASLPPMYRSYDLNRGYKVVINEPQPYLHFDQDRDRYSRYRNYQERQPVIHESDDDRYRKHWDDKRYGYDKWNNNGWGKRDGDHRDDDHREGKHHDD